MNTLIAFFQDMASHVPDLLQPFIIAAAGAIPFIEGEVSSVIGVWAGMNPVVAGIAGAIGNFICVSVIVLLGARARRAVVARRAQKRETVRAAVDSNGTEIAEVGVTETHTDENGVDRGDVDPHLGEGMTAGTGAAAGGKPESKGRIKFKRFLTRFGVPGASLLGPLAIPTQITSSILVGAGVKTSWILLWQGIAIAVWTTLTTLIATGALTLFAG
ncbi:small multidrug efflux protein [Brevibacterium sp. UCMA 11754]|uniref:small multidrug efflux protein n=1 Tax=Brevibacterium sp. UCMA 11754 TaxID=2749198 RepID=UPI001F18FF35|nr:small multidrug efflux protein [Brevibacterium sp. UCMA 11754]MCF2573594.1 small multidrug efflux protein [Brevibacterium sp. UCMA 11754]